MGTMPLWALTQNVDEAYEAMLEGEKENVIKRVQDVSLSFSSPTDLSDGEGEKYSQQIADSLYRLYEEDIYLKEIYTKMAAYDPNTEKERMELIFVFEDRGTGESIWLSKEFQYGTGYEALDKPATVEGNISEEVEEELRKLFE
ncbi:MAG: hypothetical protein ACI4DO_03850 [Roseburia sp.]